MSKADPPRLLAARIVLTVARDGAYANILLPAELSKSNLDSRDRRFVSSLVYGSLRAQGELDEIIANVSGRSPQTIDLDILVLARLGVFQLLKMRVEAHAAVYETILVSKKLRLHRGSGFLNAVLRKVADQPAEIWEQVIAKSKSVRQSHPIWIAREIEQALRTQGAGQELDEALKAQNHPARPNLCHLPGLSAPPMEHQNRFSPVGSVLPAGNPGDYPEIKNGSVRVQDEGSQLAALVLSRYRRHNSSEEIWDMCAGPGGKTALLAAEAGDSGAKILASEVSPHRAKLVSSSTEAIRRKFPRLLRIETADSTLGRTGRFSRILLDAPCSGIGALRRRPEARWAKSPDQLQQLLKIQRDLLYSGVNALNSGGVLAYVTCSPVQQETTHQISHILRRFPDLEVLDTPRILESIVCSPISGHERGSAVQLWPHRHGTDAMFIQLLKRNPS